MLYRYILSEASYIDIVYTPAIMYLFVHYSLCPKIGQIFAILSHPHLSSWLAHTRAGIAIQCNLRYTCARDNIGRAYALTYLQMAILLQSHTGTYAQVHAITPTHSGAYIDGAARENCMLVKRWHYQSLQPIINEHI